jgi:pimeloyl-ACP methyl ester carboxylesterase
MIANTPRTGLQRFRRFMTWALAAGVAAFLVVPMLITFESSGTKTYREAAGADAQFVDVNGIDVHVEIEPYTGESSGEHPVIILLHGFGASTFSWRDVIEPLSRDGEVIAYDRPGFGFTERPTQWEGSNPYGVPGNVELLDALITKFAKGREVVLVAHSAGAQIAAEFAIQSPDAVQRLVLVDPAILTTGGSPAWLNWVYDVPQIDRLGPFAVQGIATSGLDLLSESYYNKTLITDEVLAGYQKPLQVIGWEQAFWEFNKAPRTNSVVENLENIEQPTLLITGENDTVVPVEDTEELAKLIPNSTLVFITQSAHLPQEEQPQVFVYAVNAWLAGKSI